MSKTKHTAAEKRSIDRAWWALVALCEQSHRADYMLQEGLKVDRRERSSLYAAKALLVQTAADNWNSRAETLFSFAEGCRMAALAAAEGRRIAKAYDRLGDWRRFKALARKSRVAHWAAVNRALDKIARGES